MRVAPSASAPRLRSGSPGPALTPEGRGAAHGADTGRKVLVVEDDHLVSIMIEAALLDAGLAVVGIAADADEAMRLARTHRPDVAIMDIRLRGERDGVDAALDLFRELGVRSIFATAHNDPATRRRAQAARPLAWLTKPYQPEALARTVREALAGSDDA